MCLIAYYSKEEFLNKCPISALTLRPPNNMKFLIPVLFLAFASCEMPKDFEQKPNIQTAFIVESEENVGGL